MNLQHLFDEAASLKRSGDYEAALEIYRRILRLNPSLPGAHLNAAALLYKMKRYPESIHHYRCALAVDPENVPALADVAKAYEMMGEWREAIEHLRRAAVIDPSSETIGRRLRRILHEERVFQELGRTASTLERFAEQTRSEFESRFNVDMPQAIISVVADDEPSPVWAQGRLDAENRIIVKAHPNPGVMSAVVRHEYAHIAIRRFCCKTPERWVDEGTAEFLAKGILAHEREMLRSRLKDSALFSIAELRRFHLIADDRIRLAYIQAASIMGYLIETNGWEEFLGWLKDSVEIGLEMALHSRWGMSPVDLETRWLESIQG